LNLLGVKEEGHEEECLLACVQWCLRRGPPGVYYKQTSVKGPANVYVSAYRSRYRFWLLLVVRYVKKPNENEYAGSIGIRSEREQSLSSPTPTFDKANHLLRNCEKERKKERRSLTWILRTTSGYHVPAVRRRDMFYAKLEDQRAEALGQI
jgi:hypothetical protein